MKEGIFKNALVLSKDIIKRKVGEGSIAIDATIGKGNDTIYLCKLVGKSGKVYGFDTQKKAIDYTLEKVEKHNFLERVILFNDSHEHLDKYIKDPVDLIIYNLGYLPGEDHNIITKPYSTIMSLKKALLILKKGGIVLITAYSGHEGGEEEKRSVEKLIKALDQKEYNVLKFDFINQKNNPPTLFGIEKI